MAISIGSAFGKIELDSSGVRSGVADARESMRGLQSSVSAMSVTMGVIMADLARNAVQMGASLVRTGVDFNAMKQSASVAFTTIIGDAGKANAVMADLQKFAAETPFEFPELATASKSLLAFGVNAEDVVGTLRRIGDIASGVGAPVGEIAELYGKAKVQGRLFAQDINQLTGRGIPVIQELAKQFGVTDAEVRALVEDGRVGFGNLEKAFVALTGKGGKFNGMMAAQSKTFNGLLSTAKDTIAQISGTVMKPFFDLMQEGLQWMVDFTSQEEFTRWVQGVADQLGLAKSMIGDFINGLQKGYGIADSLFSTLKTYKITSNVGEVLEDIYGWVEKLNDQIGKGNWGNVWAMLSNGIQNAWKNTIQPTLQEWGTKFWDWLTGPGGVIEQAKTKLAALQTGIGEWLKTNGPAAWEQLKTWGTDFWNWLTGPGGALVNTGAELLKVAASIATWLDTNWNSTIKPALDEWTPKFWEWLTGPGGAIANVNTEVNKIAFAIRDWTELEETKNIIRNAGRSLGEFLTDGIVNGVKDGKKSGEDPITAFVNSLGTRPMDPGWKALMDAGGNIAKTLWDDIVAVFNARAPEMRKWYYESFIKPLADITQQFADNAFGKPPQFYDVPALEAPGSFTRNPAGFGASGSVGAPVHLHNYIDGKEVGHVVMGTVYGEIQTLFGDASAAAGSAP